MAKSVVDKERMEFLALQYAEKYGIIDYTVRGTQMIYLVSYPKYLYNPAYTVRFTVDLTTGKATGEKLSRFYKKGLVNRH